jgi:myo-inositol catabolism protein IolC
MKTPQFVLAVDHRLVMVKACQERGVDLQRLRDFKTLVVRALGEAKKARPALADHMMALVDDQHGAAALEVAASLGVQVGQPVEEGGVSPLRFYRPDWERAIVGRRPGFVKVRFNGGPFQETTQRREQELGVARISKACEAQGVPFVPEPLLDPHPAEMADLERARVMASWLGDLRQLGVKARFWKIEGYGDPAATSLFAASLPDGEDILLLGGTLPKDRLVDCFRAARGVAKVKGFSVGRNIFWEPYLAYLEEPEAAHAGRDVLARYLEIVDLWQRAAPA